MKGGKLMKTKQNIKIKFGKINESGDMATITYEIMVLGGIEDTIKIKYIGEKKDKVEFDSDLISSLKLPKNVERELLNAIIDAAMDWEKTLN